MAHETNDPQMMEQILQLLCWLQITKTKQNKLPNTDKKKKNPPKFLQRGKKNLSLTHSNVNFDCSWLGTMLSGWLLLCTAVWLEFLRARKGVVIFGPWKGSCEIERHFQVTGFKPLSVGGETAHPISSRGRGWESPAEVFGSVVEQVWGRAPQGIVGGGGVVRETACLCWAGLSSRVSRVALICPFALIQPITLSLGFLLVLPS